MDDAFAGLVQALHPTLAVCGTPVVQPWTPIGRLEPHQEVCTRILGAWRWYGRTELMVNIRCLRIQKGACRAPCGRRITAESDPDSEWEETEQKACTWQVPSAPLTIR